MVLERDGDGTARVRNPSFSRAGADRLSLLNPAGIASNEAPLPPPEFETFALGTKGNAIGWRLKVRDLRGGLNLTRGPFTEAHTRTKASTLDTRWRDQLILPQKTATQTTPDPPAAALSQIYSARVAGTLCIAERAGNSASTLFLETSATDPTIIATNYNPGVSNVIFGLWPVVIGGASNHYRPEAKNYIGNTGVVIRCDDGWIGSRSLEKQSAGAVARPFGNAESAGNAR